MLMRQFVLGVWLWRGLERGVAGSSSKLSSNLLSSWEAIDTAKLRSFDEFVRGRSVKDKVKGLWVAAKSLGPMKDIRLSGERMVEEGTVRATMSKAVVLLEGLLSTEAGVGMLKKELGGEELMMMVGGLVDSLRGEERLQVGGNEFLRQNGLERDTKVQVGYLSSGPQEGLSDLRVRGRLLLAADKLGSLEKTVEKTLKATSVPADIATKFQAYSTTLATLGAEIHKSCAKNHNSAALAKFCKETLVKNASNLIQQLHQLYAALKNTDMPIQTRNQIFDEIITRQHLNLDIQDSAVAIANQAANADKSNPEYSQIAQELFKYMQSNQNTLKIIEESYERYRFSNNILDVYFPNQYAPTIQMQIITPSVFKVPDTTNQDPGLLAKVGSAVISGGISVVKLIATAATVTAAAYAVTKFIENYQKKIKEQEKMEMLHAGQPPTHFYPDKPATLQPIHTDGEKPKFHIYNK